VTKFDSGRAAARWTLVATIIGSAMTFVDGTVVNVALPALQADLHATITDVQWVIEAYALFLGGLILVGGALGDQFGRKRIFLVGVVWFTLASMACGLAVSTGALIVARALQGAGAAFLVPGSLAIITATFDDADRGKAIGTWSGFSAITTAIGPVAGGWLIEHVSWRAVFFLNAPLALVVLVLSFRFMSESRDPSRTQHVDWVGAALAVLGLGVLTFGFLEWPRIGLKAPLVYGSLIAGSALLAAFLLVEARVADPMLPLGLFRSRCFAVTNVLTLLLYGALGTVFWLVPMNLIQVQHYSATAAGAAFLPFPVIMFALSRWSGGLVAAVGSRLPLTVGPIVSAVGLALYARPGIGGSYWTTFFPAVIVLGLGMTLVVAPLTTTVMNAVDPRHAGIASGVNNAVSRIAGLMAIAVLGILLVTSFSSRADQSLDRIALASGERGAVDRELPKLAGAEIDAILPAAHRAPVQRAIDESFVAAFRLVMLTAAAVAACAGIAGLFTG
jgi:EmrB/QacA subfamily drug resistance transporter